MTTMPINNITIIMVAMDPFVDNIHWPGFLYICYLYRWWVKLCDIMHTRRAVIKDKDIRLNIYFSRQGRTAKQIKLPQIIESTILSEIDDFPLTCINVVRKN